MNGLAVSIALQVPLEPTIHGMQSGAGIASVSNLPRRLLFPDVRQEIHADQGQKYIKDASLVTRLSEELACRRRLHFGMKPSVVWSS